jgi:hypothetical protein
MPGRPQRTATESAINRAIADATEHALDAFEREFKSWQVCGYDPYRFDPQSIRHGNYPVRLRKVASLGSFDPSAAINMEERIEEHVVAMRDVKELIFRLSMEAAVKSASQVLVR